MNDKIKIKQKMAFLIKHITTVKDNKDLVHYILINQDKNFIKDTIVKKFFMAYSLLTEEIIKKIN